MPLGRLPSSSLTIAGGPGSGRRFALARGDLVGRGVDCSVRLDDPGISRAHAVITVADSGVAIADLEPTNP